MFGADAVLVSEEGYGNPDSENPASIAVLAGGWEGALLEDGLLCEVLLLHLYPLDFAYSLLDDVSCLKEQARKRYSICFSE